jgi:hypothetical protein
VIPTIGLMIGVYILFRFSKTLPRLDRLYGRHHSPDRQRKARLPLRSLLVLFECLSTSPIVPTLLFISPAPSPSPRSLLRPYAIISSRGRPQVGFSSLRQVRPARQPSTPSRSGGTDSAIRTAQAKYPQEELP